MCAVFDCVWISSEFCFKTFFSQAAEALLSESTMPDLGEGNMNVNDPMCIECSCAISARVNTECTCFHLFLFFLLTGLLCTQEVKIYWVTSLQTLNLSFFKTHFFWDFSNQAQHADQKSPFTGFLPSHAFWAAQEAAKPVNNNNNYKDINSVRYL